MAVAVAARIAHGLSEPTGRWNPTRTRFPRLGCPVASADRAVNGPASREHFRRSGAQGCLIMSNEKRFVLFIAFVFVWMIALTLCHRGSWGWNPPPKKPPAPSAAAAKSTTPRRMPTPTKAPARTPRQARGGQAKGRSRRSRPSPPAPKPSTRGRDRAGRRVRAGPRLDDRHGPRAGIASRCSSTQKGAGVESVIPSRFDAEFENGQAVEAPAAS